MNRLMIMAAAMLVGVTALQAQSNLNTRVAPIDIPGIGKATPIRHAAPARAGDLTDGANTEIRTVKGDKRYITVSGWGFVDSNTGLKPTSFDMASDIVYGNDACYYIHAPLGGTRSAYVKGELSDDCKTVYVQYPQVINTVSAPDRDGVMLNYPVYAEVMQAVTEEDEQGQYTTYIPCNDEDRNLITYTISDDGSVYMDPAIQESFETDGANHILAPQYLLSEYVTVPAYVLDPNAGDDPVMLWLGPGCINTSYNTLPDDIIEVYVPENLEWNGSWVAKGSSNQYPISVAFDDEKIYVKGLSRQDRVTSDVFVGIVTGEQVIFPKRQFLGYDESNHELIYMASAKGEMVTDEDGTYIQPVFSDTDLVMNYDEEQGVMSYINDDDALMITASLKRTDYFYTFLYQPVMLKQVNDDLNASPMAPRILDWQDLTEKYGVYMLAVRILNTNINGALLDTSRMYYTIFVDDEPYYFNGPNNGFEADECFLPYDANGHDIFCQGGGISSLYIDVENPHKVGVQSYYVGSDNQTYGSQMVVLTLSEGVEQTIGDVTPVSRTYYDISGRKVENPTPGSFLIEVVRMSDGSLKISKTKSKR